jgi:hypothetical protein
MLATKLRLKSFPDPEKEKRIIFIPNQEKQPIHQRFLSKNPTQRIWR